jgi:AraC-like DNA-binding protein
MTQPDTSGHARMQDWASLQRQLIWCYSGPVNQMWRSGTHMLDDMIAWFLLKGSVIIQSGADKFSATEDYWIVPRKGSTSREFSPDALIISVHFQACWADKRNIFDDGLPLVFPGKNHPELRRQATKLANFTQLHFDRPGTLLPWRETTLEVFLRVQGLFQNWLVNFVQAAVAEGLTVSRFGQIGERVRHGLFLIDQMPLDEKFPKNRLSRELGLSESQLDRLFSSEVGFTPRSYFEKRRVEQARHLLSGTSAMVKEVAYGLGFQSTSHFSTWFRRFSGQSPVEYAETVHRE